MSEQAKAPEKTKSRIEVLHEEWKANGGKPASAAINKNLVADYQRAKKAQDAAKEALSKATAAVSEAAANIIRHNGKGRVRIAGEVHVPMARGETVFFRTEGGGEVKDLGGKG